MPHFLGAIAFLVRNQNSFLDRARGHGDEFQNPPAFASGRRRERPLRADLLIQIVEDGSAVDQGLAVIQDQRGNAAQGIGVANFRPILPHDGKRPVLEGQFVEMHRRGDAADEGREIAAN